MMNYIELGNDSIRLRPTEYIKRIKEFGPHTFIMKRTETMISDFMISKRAIKQPYSVKEPCVDEVNVRMSQEVRSLETANRKLLKTREIHHEKRRKLDGEFQHVMELVHVLRSGHIDFEEFVKENHEKRERLQKGNLQELIRERKIEIDSLHDETTQWIRLRKLYEQFLRQHKIHEQYLYKVVAISSGEFQNCEEIIRRYEAITEARVTCDNKLKKNMLQVQDHIQDLQQKNMGCKMEVLNLKNRVCALYTQYGMVHNNSLVWENIVQKVKKAVLDEQKDKQQIAEACWNLYLLMCHRQNGQVKFARGNVNKQMVSIKNSLLKSTKILSTVTRNVKTKIGVYEYL